MGALFRYRPALAIFVLLFVLWTIPMIVTAQSVPDRSECELPRTVFSETSPFEEAAETVFDSVQDNTVPVDSYVHHTDSGGFTEKPAGGYHVSFRETLLQNSFSLSKPPGRFPILLGYAGRIRCLDTVIAFNLGGNAPPLFRLGETTE